MVEDGQTLTDEVEFTEGMEIERGFISPYFVKNQESQVAELENPLVLVTDLKISNMQELVPLLEGLVSKKEPLLIIADDVTGEALSSLVLNKMRGCAATAPLRGRPVARARSRRRRAAPARRRRPPPPHATAPPPPPPPHPPRHRRSPPAPRPRRSPGARRRGDQVARLRRPPPRLPRGHRRDDGRDLRHRAARAHPRAGADDADAHARAIGARRRNSCASLSPSRHIAFRSLQVTMEMLGRAQRAAVFKERTTMIATGDHEEEVNKRIAQVKAEGQATDSEFDREKAEERVAKLGGAIGRIKVGAATETELKDKKLRYEDALNSVRRRWTRIVPGGGPSLVLPACGTRTAAQFGEGGDGRHASAARPRVHAAGTSSRSSTRWRATTRSSPSTSSSARSR